MKKVWEGRSHAFPLHYTTACNLTMLIVSLLSQFLCLVILAVLLRFKRDLYEHFSAISHETNEVGVAV